MVIVTMCLEWQNDRYAVSFGLMSGKRLLSGCDNMSKFPQKLLTSV
jgi:hypothetical protein